MKRKRKVWLTALVAAALAVVDTLVGAGVIPEVVQVVLDVALPPDAPLPGEVPQDQM